MFIGATLSHWLYCVHCHMLELISDSSLKSLPLCRSWSELNNKLHMTFQRLQLHSLAIFSSQLVIIPCLRILTVP